MYQRNFKIFKILRKTFFLSSTWAIMRFKASISRFDAIFLFQSQIIH